MVSVLCKFTTAALQRPTTTQYHISTGLVRAGKIFRKVLRRLATAEMSMHLEGRPAVQHNCSRLSGTAARGCRAWLLAVVGIAKHAAGRSQQCIQRLTQQHTQLSCAKKHEAHT